MSYCEANDLAVGYNSPLLEHIKFAAERGQILTLIGPNGAGKSTLMKTLAAQLAPQGGAVLLDGQSLSVYSPNARARKMALMVPHTNRTELIWIENRESGPFAYGALTRCGRPSHAVPLESGFLTRARAWGPGASRPATPARQRPQPWRRRRFGLARFRSPLLARSRLISPPRGT